MEVICERCLNVFGESLAALSKIIDNNSLIKFRMISEGKSSLNGSEINPLLILNVACIGPQADIDFNQDFWRDLG